MPEPRVCAVVAAYQPSVPLSDLVQALQRQTDAVVVVDDGSPTPVADLPSGVEVITSPVNRGIAASLNTGATWAGQRGASHILTLDQDSMIDDGYVRQLVSWWGQAAKQGLRPGAMGPGLLGDVVYRGERVGDLLRVAEVMQSGALFDLQALTAAGGFSEDLVIDGVDTDVSRRLLSAGYAVLICPLPLRHRLGRTRALHILGRTVLLTRHAPFRDYYMTRNRLLIAARNWHQDRRFALGLLRRTAVAIGLTLIFDRPRRAKSAAIAHGVRDALRGVTGPLPGPQRERWS